MDYFALGAALLALGGAVGVAYGYRGQRDIERDQVTYLRKQLAGVGEPPPAGSRALPVPRAVDSRP